VRNGLRELVLDGEGPAETIAAPASNGMKYSWSADGRTRVVRRTWLDTFDWRLYRAGLTLEQTGGRGAAELTLTGRDGEVIAAQQLSGPEQITWPSLLSALPPGPLPEHLEPVVGVRALAPVARAVSRIQDQRVLNGDEKTIARVAEDRMAVTFPSAGTAPARLTVQPLRGYQAQAGRLLDALAAGPGVMEGSQSALEAALAAAGRRPADYSGKIEEQLTASMPAGEAVAVVLTALLDTLEANVRGTVHDIDTEFLHDLRVAVRRTRSALKLAGDALPAGLAHRFAPEFRWLGALTTPTRDLDVYLLEYPSMAASLVAATPRELQPFHDHLTRSRAAAQRGLARGLRSARFTQLTAKWRAELAQPPKAKGKRPAAGPYAAARIARAHQRVLAGGSAITETSLPEKLHDLRKRCKELRYLLEIFGSLYEPAEHWQAVRELKDLQNCLGEFQDCEVQHAEIRTFAAEMMAQRSAPAPTLLAMGEIAAGLARRQHRARGEFGERFRAFASPAGQAKFAALTQAALQ
jgi:CHAD domain-containing protein